MRECFESLYEQFIPRSIASRTRWIEIWVRSGTILEEEYNTCSDGIRTRGIEIVSCFFCCNLQFANHTGKNNEIYLGELCCLFVYLVTLSLTGSRYRPMWQDSH
jgi:hypothetical protein